MVVRTEKQLGEQIKAGASRIEVEGPLVKKVKKIHKTGKTAWKVCAAALTVSMVTVSIAVATGGAGSVIAVPTFMPVVTVIGMGPAVSAALIGVAAGGIGGLNKLRNYSIVSYSQERLVLER